MAATNLCLHCGDLTDRDRYCSDVCAVTTPTKDTRTGARVAVSVVAGRPQYDGVGMIGALDEWVRWSA